MAATGRRQRDSKMYYDGDADPSALAGQTVADHRLRQPGPRPRPQPPRERGRRRRRARAGLEEPRDRRGRGAQGPATSRTRSRPADVVMILVPDTAQKAVYDGEIGPNLRAGPPPDVRPRVQHPLRADRPARHRRRRRWSRPRARATCSARSTRPAAACRRCSPSIATSPARPATGRWPTPGRSARRGPASSRRRSPRRPRPTCSASSRVLCGGDRGAGQDGVRDARRGRLPAGARVLRDDARAEAHRRPDVPRRPQLHALQRQRHRRVRRLRLGAADHRRPRARDHAAGPQGDPGRHVRRPLDRRERVRAAPSSSASARRTASTRSSGSAARLRAQMPFLNPVEVEAGQAQAAADDPGRVAMSAAAYPVPPARSCRRAASASSTRPCATASRRPAPG